jgi:DNA-binding transcriptional ArsR family regulator
MITVRFGPADLAKVRFAISPLFELWQSVRALQDPTTHALHGSWLADNRKQLADLDLSLLYALQPPRGINADFIHPPPTRPLPELDDELAQLATTPRERVRREVSQAYGSGPLSPVLSRLIADPDSGLAELAGVLRAYWASALAPYWERIRAVLERDILYRARQSADGGAEALFAGLHKMVRYADAQIVIDWGCPPCDSVPAPSVCLDGRGLLLVPSVFITFAGLIYEAPWQPTIVYSARGTGLLWEPVPSAPDALGALIGSRRAAVLALLDVPRSTTELAQQLQVSPGGISQHLSVLRSNGLVSRHRVGSVVLYARSPAGELLAKGYAENGPLPTQQPPRRRRQPWALNVRP